MRTSMCTCTCASTSARTCASSSCCSWLRGDRRHVPAGAAGARRPRPGGAFPFCPLVLGGCGQPRGPSPASPRRASALPAQVCADARPGCFLPARSRSRVQPWGPEPLPVPAPGPRAPYPASGPRRPPFALSVRPSSHGGRAACALPARRRRLLSGRRSLGDTPCAQRPGQRPRARGPRRTGTREMGGPLRTRSLNPWPTGPPRERRLSRGSTASVPSFVVSVGRGAVGPGVGRGAHLPGWLRPL